jgi:tetratricopeptide (TPR) repeat protein
MKKFVLASAAILGMISGSYAQTLQDAIKKTENERYEAADADFKALVQKEPNKGENYFYYGDNFFQNEDLDSALIMYKKGAEVSPMYPLNFVGIGKVYLFKGNEGEANTNIFKAKTLADDKTNKAYKALTYMEIAEAYTKAPMLKNLPEAIKLLTEATKLDSKNPEVYILMGDALLEQNPTDGSAPIKLYDKAFELDKKSAKAVIRKGKLYERSKNYTEALKYYKDAIAIDATFAPAYREMAEIFTKATRYQESIENWKKYLELNNSPKARVRYAYSLFQAKQYQNAVTEIELLLQKPNEINKASTNYLLRVLSYSYYEVGDKTDKDVYKKGSEAITKFFDNTQGTDFKYLPDDYKYKGLLLSKNGQDSLAVVELEKAINLDPVANCELWGEVGKIWVKAKRYDKGIVAYETKAKCPKGLNTQDWYDLGRAYFYGPKDFVKADTAFSKLTQLNATWPIGYFWRAKANEQQDLKNEKWLAKPYYEKGFELVKPEERSSASYKSNIIAACEYLGYYYLVKKDNAKAKEFFSIIRDLDPNNQKQKDFFKSPAGK